MPMSEKGHEIMGKFMAKYGKKKGKSYAYAKANKNGPESSLYALLHGGK